MRITQKLMENMVRQSTDRAARALADAARPIEEGTSISRPSQDPTKATRLMGLRDLDREFDRLDKSRAMVKTDLSQAEEALGGVHDILVQAQEIGLSMANDTANPGDRAGAARRVQGLLSQALGLVNRKDASGKHLFGGTAEGAPAYAADGTYQGLLSSRLVEIGSGLSIEASVTGPTVFGEKSEGLVSIRSLAEALEANDLGRIQTALGSLADARQIVSDGRTDIGGRLATLDDVDELSLALRTHVGIERGGIEGVDIAAVAPAMATAQTTLEAVLQTSKTLLAQIGRGLLG